VSSSKSDLYVIVVSKKVKCPENGGEVSVSGYTGSIRCPNPSEFCAKDRLVVTNNIFATPNPPKIEF
jgi:hypothetical protein